MLFCFILTGLALWKLNYQCCVVLGTLYGAFIQITMCKLPIKIAVMSVGEESQMRQHYLETETRNCIIVERDHTVCFDGGVIEITVSLI